MFSRAKAVRCCWWWQASDQMVCWARSTLQLHQQRLTPCAAAYLSVVMPPESEVVAPLSVWSASGIQPGPCSMVEPCMDLTEDHGVIVGRTLVDASSWSASVLMVNPSADVIVLACFACVGNLSRWLLRSLFCKVRSVGPCQIIWKTSQQDTTPLWGRPFGYCSGTFSIGMHMCSRCSGNLSQDIPHQYSMRS